MKKKGISLIVLIVTIVVIIILATITIISITKNNPIQKAKQSKFISDVSNFKDELSLSHANNLADDYNYKKEDVNVDAGNYLGMKEYIKDITEDYAKVLYIRKGELLYVNSNNENYDENEAIWFGGTGVGK